MKLTAEEFEKRRSPQELRDFVEAVKSYVRSNRAERQRGHLKKGLYKPFLEELVPLSIFAIVAYPASYQVKPVRGNQAYDAVVFDGAGVEVDRVEITAPHDGKAAAEDAMLLVSRGYGEVHSGDPKDVFKPDVPLLLHTCLRKAAKDYSGCTLVISISPIPPFPEYEKEYCQRLGELTAEISKIKFRAKRVFLQVLPDDLIAIQQ